jgi:hypothetical protein
VGKLRGQGRERCAREAGAEHAGRPDGKRVCESISSERNFWVGEPPNLESRLKEPVGDIFFS